MGNNISSRSVDDWKVTCAAWVIGNCTTATSLFPDGLVDITGHGVHVDCARVVYNNLTMPDYVWGINTPTCNYFCGADKLIQVVKFPLFAAEIVF